MPIGQYKEFLVETQEKKIKQNANADAMANDVKNEAEAVGSRFEHVNEALELLYKHFPKCFIKEGDCKPLKIGILDDLRSQIEGIEGLSISKARAAVRLYTSRLRYHYCCKEGAKRIDLEGNEVESISAEHAEYSKKCFEEIKAKRKAANANKKGFKKPFNKDNNKGTFKKPFNKNGPKRFKKPRTVKATVADLKAGREVLVTSNGRFVKGIVKQDANANSVTVTLDTGATVTLLIERVSIAQK